MSLSYVVARDTREIQKKISHIKNEHAAFPEGIYKYWIKDVFGFESRRNGAVVTYIIILVELSNKKYDICKEKTFQFELSNDEGSAYQLFMETAMAALGGINILNYETILDARGYLKLSHLNMGYRDMLYVKEFKSMKISKKRYAAQLKRWQLEAGFFEPDKDMVPKEIVEQATAAFNNPSNKCWLPKWQDKNDQTDFIVRRV